MSYFEHVFETRIARHAVGTYHYTVVYLDPSLHAALPLDRHARLRIEADVSGVPVKGAWQPARGKWYLMLPKDGLKAAGLRIGSSVEVSFRVSPQDDVEIPDELAALLAAKARVHGRICSAPPWRRPQPFMATLSTYGNLFDAHRTPMMQRVFQVIFLVLVVASAGCNTVKGVGQDIQRAGESIEGVAKKK